MKRQFIALGALLAVTAVQAQMKYEIESDTIRIQEIEDINMHKTGSPNNARLFSSKSNLTVMENPQPVAMVTHEVIEQQQSKQLSDVLQNVNGLYITSSRGNSQDSFGGRGFNFGNDNIFKNNLELTKLRSYGGFRAVDGLQYIGILIVISYFGFGRITESYPVTIGSMYIIIDYVAKIFDNLKTVVLRLAELEQSYASATHVFDLLKLDTAEKLPEEIGDIKGDVKFEDVYFAYKEDDVLKGIDFEVKSGESIAFVGSTGSGKSTIINLLINFYQPRKANIYLDGKNINSIERSSLRKDMAVVLQDSFLFETNIKENIRLGGKKYSDEYIKRALIDVGGESIVERGIEEEILEKGNNLSQGEKQLISFARAYIRNPKILILDEATSNIDSIIVVHS